MEGPVTLTADEFKEIHNALYDFRGLNNILEDAIKEQTYLKLRAVENRIRAALNGAYVQEAAIFKDKHRYYDGVQAEKKFNSCWSIYEAGVLNREHPYQGAKYMSYLNQCVDIKGPQWIDLWEAADWLIKKSNDYHIYIEGFEQTEINPEMLFLTTGS